MRLLTVLANRSQAAKDFMSDWASVSNRILQFDLRDEAPFYIRIRNGKAECAKGTADQPHVVLRGRASVFARMINGSLDAEEAYSGQKYDIIGSIDDAIRFRYMSELVQANSRLVRFLRRALQAVS